MADFLKQFKEARRVSTPLLAVRTPDGAATIRSLAAMLNGKSDSTPIVRWDVVRGLVGINKVGKDAANQMLDGKDPAIKSARPSDMLTLVMAWIGTITTDNDPRCNTIVFMMNGQDFWADPVVSQAIWNLRDPLKAKGLQLVMLCTKGAILPPKLADDVMMLDEPLPTEEELKRICLKTYANIQLPAPPEEVVNKAIDAMIGLAAYPAEQTLAMSLSKTNGLDYDNLWERKRSVVEQTRGLSVNRDGFKFGDIGGCDNAKNYFTSLLKSGKVRVVAFIDEIEKAFAGSGTDLSGVKTEMTGTMLTWMQDHNALGSLFLGPPGCTKTMMAKAIGNEGNILTVAFDFGAMQSSLVGSSGENLRAGLKIIEAVSGGGEEALFIGTCNAIDSLKPELRRRFKLATFFYDLPSPAERKLIWEIYLKKFKLSGPLPNDKGWTGAEIQSCCQQAAIMKMSLKEAATYIVPVSVSAADQITELRKTANNRFVSASYPGPYKWEETATAKDEDLPTATRFFRVEPGAMGNA